ncbi:uncharacterized protein LOC120772772 isoform X1 [Bactrocera tryoni]|uniref:uncharacterized protein LOC120772772 isoform X1 n=1 Tax=Bactrocera tryoni TaxID=59916 RepID=UPI001A968097|nr:uncharacterized protein LOC120772772 isoform X1 [Bactrocera tryoni]XP_039957480.1 uncharacterized protein LOC120772772 isoform X1 [Bactrocera tryoni]
MEEENMIEPKKEDCRKLVKDAGNVGILERTSLEQLPRNFDGKSKPRGSAVGEDKSPTESMFEEPIEGLTEDTTELETQRVRLEEHVNELPNDDDSPTPRVLMKVDKAVSTNDTLEDLQRALTYEVIFSTLLQKKVMAIKRECEERKRAKRMKRKSIGRIFFSRKLFGGSRKLRGDSEPDVFMRGEFDAMMASPTALRSTKTAAKRTSGSSGRKDGDEIEVFSTSASASNGSHRSQLARATLTKTQKVKTQLTTAHGAAGGQPADDSVASTLSNSSEKNDVSGAGAAGGQTMVRRSLLVRAQTHTPAEVMTSSSGSGDSRAATHRRSVSVINGNGNSNGNGGNGGLPVSLLERTFDTTSLASGYENGTGARLHTSTMADDSLTSLRDSIESLSFGSSRCTVSFGGAEIIPDETASLIYERARLAKRLRILEAKSISAQCSPVLPRHLIATIPAPATEPMPPLAQTTVSINNAMQAATTTKHIITPTTAVPYTAAPRAGAYTTIVGSEITTVPTSNKITQTKQHIFRHQVSYTDSTYGGAGDFGDMSAYSRYISRQNTSEESANLTVSTLLNQSDSLSLHAPICSPTAAGGGGGGVGAFMLGDRFKSKSTSLLVVGGMGRNRLLPTPQIVQAPFVPATSADGAGAVSGTLPCNISHSDQLVDSFNTKKFTASGYAAPAAPSNAQNQLPAHRTTINGSTAATKTFSPATTVYQATTAAGITDGTTAVVPLNGSRVRNGNANGVIVGGAAVPADTAKLNRMTSTSTGSSVAPTGCCTTTKSSSRGREKNKQRYKPSWPSGQSGSDDEYRKRKRKYKRYHRCSDPVLVYPTPSGLQHCILSMPPNEPLQFQYNDNFPYDMQIQTESDKNDDLEEIVPSSHRRHRKHRHHRHKKRRRHKKPKILVQDLETRIVKVVDPDDLSQRARCTIVVTACLLLVMCLMLVGVTLRMAPLIDDMVRQESERLLKESLDRARSNKNATEAAAHLALQQIP